MKIISEFTIDISAVKKITLAVPETKWDFSKYYKLRYEILREPWNQPKGSEKDEGDKTSHHVCLLHNDIIIGVCRLQMNSNTQAQIRYMAVHENYRGESLGAVMLTYFERLAKSKGVTNIILEARETAVKFYERNGYEMKKKTFLLFDEIQHYQMKKKIK